jgi:nitrogen fixation/metabolism regulation signal transduction histidine kinase
MSDENTNSSKLSSYLKSHIYIILGILAIILCIVIFSHFYKKWFGKKTKTVLLDDPHLKKSYENSNSDDIKILEKKKLSTTEPDYDTKIQLINEQILQLQKNEGFKLKRLKNIPSDLSFSYVINFRLISHSNSYKKYCFFYRGNDLSNSSPSFWIDPVKSALIINIKDYDGNIMEIKTDSIPLQRWNTVKILFNNRNVDIHLNNSHFKTTTLDSMPKYENGNIKIHHSDHSENSIKIKKITYFNHA